MTDHNIHKPKPNQNGVARENDNAIISDEEATLKIAALNDAFRSNPFNPDVGRFYCTCGIVNISDKHRIEAIKRLVTFDDFTEDNDPYGLHDLGCIKIDGIEKVFWKIDVFADDTLTYGCDTPDAPQNSYRVLTLMLASEY